MENILPPDNVPIGADVRIKENGRETYIVGRKFVDGEWLYKVAVTNEKGKLIAYNSIPSDWFDVIGANDES